MMKDLIIFCFLFLIVIQTNGNNKSDKIEENNLKTEVSLLKNEIKILKEENDIINIALSEANANILNLQKSHVEQIEFYGAIQKSTIWIISIVFIILSGVFTAFIWVFKRPDEIWSKLREKEKDAKLLLNRLETEYQHQKSLFILGDKGLYSYTSSDWSLIKKI